MENSETCGEIFKGQVRPVCRASKIPPLYTAGADQQYLPPPDEPLVHALLAFGLHEKEIQGPTLIG